MLINWVHLDYAPANRILESIDNRTIGRSNFSPLAGEGSGIGGGGHLCKKASKLG
jgi:hypothetical protein